MGLIKTIKPTKRPKDFYPTISRGKWYQGVLNTPDTDVTFRTKHEALVDCHTLRLEFGNFYQDDDPVRITSLDTFTLNCTVEVGSKFYDVTFEGNGTTVKVPPGTQVISNSLSIELSKGDTFYVRAHLTIPTAGKFPYNIITTKGNGEGKTAGDQTKSTAAFPTATLAAFGPLAIYATPTNPNFEAVACIGDSISVGANHDGNISVDGHIPGEIGFMQIAAMRSGRGYITLGMNGQMSSGFVSDKRMRRMILASRCDVAIVNYGTNDLAQQRPLSEIQANLLDIWKALKMRGLRVYQTTITPRTNSTDNWTTTSGQTPINSFTSGGTGSPRTNLNEWIRSKPGPHLDGVIDVAALVESGENSGLWAPGKTPDGTHPNTETHHIMADAVVYAIS